MAQNTNLNVSPYYDDFDKNKNFYRVLFRPGFPIQARELTTMQSIMQNQVESIGTHLFKDGAMVIPGQVGYDLNVDAIMLQESFLGANVEDYRAQLEGKIIEGLTSGIKAKVLYTVSEAESEKGYITLYVKYIQSGGDENTQTVFTTNEQLVTDKEITFGTSLIEVGSPFAQLLPTEAIQVGSVAYVQTGVYYIRGFFVDVPYQYILLDQYGSSPQYRVGLDILESIITPEDDLSLNDNAAGTSNYAAPGSHRFKISTRLSKKLLTDDADKDFIELLRINGDRIENLVDRSAYNEIERTMATRTYEESGDYTVQDFQITMRDQLNDGFNNGVYQVGQITSGGRVAAENYYSVEVGPGAAYVRGYRTKTLSSTYVDLIKPREIDAAQNQIIPFELGNYSLVENIWGFPNFSGSSISNAYQTLEIRSEFGDPPNDGITAAAGNIIGFARILSLEHIGDPNNAFGDTDDRYKMNIFDIQMFTVLELASAVTIPAGSIVIGKSSGASGIVVDAETAEDHIQLYQVYGTFEKGEMVTLDGRNLDTIELFYTYQYSDARQVVARDEGTQVIEFTGNLVLEDSALIRGATFTYTSVDGDILTVDNVSAADASRTPGTYTIGTTDYTSTGSGVNATFSIVVAAGGAATVSVTAGGSAYVVDNTITVQDAQLGGGGGAALTFDVATVGKPNVVGLDSNFASDLRAGDRIYFNESDFVTVNKINPTNLTGTGIDTIFDYAAQKVFVTPPAAPEVIMFAPAANTYGAALRVRAALFGNDENSDLLSRMPRDYVKSISDESMTVRRTFDAQTVSANSVSITLPENEQFSALSDVNYTITILASTNTTYPAGDVVPIDTTNTGNFGYTTFTSADRTTIQINNLTNVTSIKVTATLSKNVVQKKTKSPQKMFILKVNRTLQNLDQQNYQLGYLNIYGTRIEDQEISLGLKDAYELHAVYESLDDNDPVIPSVTLVEPRFFAVGTVVTGKTSKARAKVVEFLSSNLKLSVVMISGQFVLGEGIDGFDSNGDPISGIIGDADGSVVVGSKVITNRYELQTGQTGFMYDCSRIVRKKGYATPLRKIKVVVDYYNHSATGDYFGGQSYLQTDYEDVPQFQNKYLSDYLDFRPGVKNLYSGTGTVSSPAYVNCSTFDFKSRVFNISGTPTATIFDIPKLNSDFRCDYDWYLPRIDKIYLTSEGEFQIVKGKSSEIPVEPDGLQEAMLLATLFHRPYGFIPNEDVAIVKSDNKRFTMRDIGALEKRIDQVEYYTSLSLLESNTLNLDIVDDQGKNRLKNGFFVEDFTDHGKAAVALSDFACSFDYARGRCHPSHYTTNVSLQINESLSSNIRQTGPIITLPYTELMIIDQPYASRVENVNPFNVFTYIGRIELTPSSDDWIDTDRVPAQVTSVEGDFEATFREMGADQNGFAPIQWGAWETTWTGTSTSTTTQNVNRRSDWGRGRATDQITTTTTTTVQTQEGIRTQVVPRIDMVSQGDSLVSSTVIPWIRSRNIDVNIQRMKPRTAFYSFFDGRSVDDYLMPKVIEVIKDPATDSRTNSTPFVVGETVVGQTSGVTFQVAAPNDYFDFNPYDDTEMPTSYSSTTNFINIDTLTLAAQAVGDFYGNMQVGEVLVGSSGATAVVADRRILSDRLGQYRGSLFIPDPSVDTNPRWNTGNRTLRFTTNEDDSRLAGAVASSAETEYQAAGTLNVLQENILAVRNAELVRDTVTQDRTLRTTRTSSRQVGWWDPLAQSFLVEEQGGVFLTSVDVYFNAKDDNIPISMQIRTMENGYPTTSILPFSDVTLTPNDIQTSETGAIATKFTFRAPVYIPESIEHCFVLFSDSNEYQVWISRMGELDISGDRTISEQPYAGVLFKSQNATTWTADQYEDMKFSIYRADFDTTTTSTVVLNNAKLAKGNSGIINLAEDAVQTFQPELQLTLNSNTLPYTIGARLYQKTTLAEGTIIDVQETVSNIVLTINDISGAWQSGSDTGGIITNRIVSSKTTATMVVTSATGDFTVGETISGSSSAQPTAEVVTWDSGTNTLTLRFVSTNFDTVTPETITGGDSGVTATVSTVGYSGDAIEGAPAAVSDAFVSSTPSYTSTQRKIRVRHSNHGMHDNDNNVQLSGVESEINPTFLTSSISASDTSIPVNDALAFHKRINGSTVSTTNVGYIKIGDEVMSYGAISADGKTITVHERGVDGTTATAHADEVEVMCYNLDGIPLPEINKTHTSLSNPTLDAYDITTTSIANNGITSGGPNINASQNIQYEILLPQLQTVALPKTNILGRANTVTGTSINDGETVIQNSFVNSGAFNDIALTSENYYNSPQLICSEVNESAELNGAKSFRLDLSMTSESSTVSPQLDTDRMSLILISNRINNPSDPNTALLATGDEHSAVYITKASVLSNPSRSIKLLFAGYRPPNTFIKPLYRVLPTGSTDSIEDYGYQYFPTEDASIPNTTDLEQYREYEYEVSGLDFTQYQIKLVFVSANQAFSPIIKDFRSIALAV